MIMEEGVKYVLDKRVFFGRIRELGAENISRFARETGLHRNSLGAYLTGKSVFSSAFQRMARALDLDPLSMIVPASETTAAVKGLDEIRPIVAALLRRSPGAAIVLLGSRAKGRARPYSDWDLGITRSPVPVGGEEYLGLRRVARDLGDDLVRNVDVINLDEAPGWFLQGLLDPPVFLDGDRESFSFLMGVLHGIQKSGPTV
jgi:predicted nucleotidyltransferase